MKSIKYILYFTVLCFLAWFLKSCANPVTPKGGPKDSTPPTLLEAIPPLESRNFTANKILLEFDEYVEIKDLNKQLIISPPMEETPEFKIKGKSVVIELKEELKDSTTYNIYIGDAIVDITEGNPAKNFRYVFSTGEILDSLSLTGQLLNAFDLLPVENISVMLYLDNNDTIPFDSVPYFVKPYYLSRTDAQGLFEFHNLIDKPFKIFALEDANSNLIFDQITERIAFIDSILEPYYIEIPFIDTIPNDSTGLLEYLVDTAFLDEEIIIYAEIEKIEIDSNFFEIPDYENMPDSLLYDSLEAERESLILRLFAENDSLQRFMKASMENENKLLFVFRQPTIQHKITPLNLEKDTSWYIEDINKTKDTIAYWITNLIQDSITFIITDDTIILDTIDVALVKKSRNKRQQKKEEEKPKELNFKFAKNAPELNGSYNVSFAFPIKEYSLDGSLFIEGEDTLSPSFEFNDSIKLTGKFIHEWKEETAYQLLLPDSSFFDILQQSHDTIKKTFRTKALADYGNLYINTVIKNPGKNHIIQLLKGEKIHTEIELMENLQLSFEYLDPGDYRLKVIYDDNENHKWDSGDYIYNIQPEKVDYMPKTITVRANWDIEEEWEL